MILLMRLFCLPVASAGWTVLGAIIGPAVAVCMFVLAMCIGWELTKPEYRGCDEKA